MLEGLKGAVPLSIRKVARRVAGDRKPTLRPAITRPGSGTPETLSCCVAYNEHGGYCVPIGSIARPSAQRVMAGGVWEPDTLALIRESCGVGDIVHAGTYFGDFLPFLSRSAVPGARVWAFEPNIEHFRCAEVTIALNGLSNVELLNAGLGASQDSAALRVEDETGTRLGGGSYVVDAEQVGRAGVQLIDIVAIDDVVPQDRDVGVVQLDVEGFEHDALAGARATIARCRPLIIVERRLEDEWFAEHLAPLGYEVVGRVDFNSVLRAGPL